MSTSFEPSVRCATEVMAAVMLLSCAMSSRMVAMESNAKVRNTFFMGYNGLGW